MSWLSDIFGRGGAQQPDAAAQFARGTALLQEGEFAAAAEHLERAIKRSTPQDGIPVPQAHYLLGRAQAGDGRLAAALLSFESALRAQPDHADALEEGARILQDLDEHAEAAQWLQRLVAVRPKAETRLQLATELRKCGRNEEAVEILRPLCKEEPGDVGAALLHHHALVSLGRLDAALAEIERVLRMCKPHADLLVNRAVPLARLGRTDEAMACIGQALKLDPQHQRALANRVSLILGQRRVPEAIAAAEDALRVHPEDPDLHWRLGAALLLAGDWERGWAESEWRTRATGYESTSPAADRPQWRGESLAGRTIFLYPEQGFGDTIQFLRFVPEVARRAQSVFLLMWPELEPLVAGALPANCRTVAPGAKLPAFDVQCALMSVPGILGTTPETIPGEVPYLHAAPAAVQAWRERLDAGTFNVGICWAGNARQYNDRDRSTTLAALRGLATPGCRFYTLQTQKRPRDEETLAAWKDVVDTGAELRDFADTAALMGALDLVITVDTSVAHLAGALGRPVWILLSYAADWRYLLERADSPWYPTARLYRQAKPGRWPPVIQRAQADLAALAAGR